jgi:Protein of unknown function (DUF2845)
MKIAAALALAACLPSVVFADGIRCGSRLLMIGDSSTELAALCDKPAQTQHSKGYRSGTTRAGVRSTDSNTDDLVNVDIWTYNFGPNKFMQRVRIEDGVIVAIDTLGYGYNEP